MLKVKVNVSILNSTLVKFSYMRLYLSKVMRYLYFVTFHYCKVNSVIFQLTGILFVLLLSESSEYLVQ